MLPQALDTCYGLTALVSGDHDIIVWSVSTTTAQHSGSKLVRPAPNMALGIYLSLPPWAGLVLLKQWRKKVSVEVSKRKEWQGVRDSY